MNILLPEPGVWYEQLVKPSWTPAPSTIGLIWSVLYPLILGGFVYVVYKVFFVKGKKKYPSKMLVPYVLNIFFNIIFTPIQFGLRNLFLAWMDIILVWLTILWMMRESKNRNTALFVSQVPYLVWVSIATTLQTSLVYLNR